jgi:hypothetical protein
MLDLLPLFAVVRFHVTLPLSIHRPRPLPSASSRSDRGAIRVCRHALAPLRCSHYSLALLSLCSFQDAHEDRETHRAPRFFKTIQLARD